MKCSICSHPNHIAILRHYVFSGSLRRTAAWFRVGYRSLARHLESCLPVIMAEYERYLFDRALKENVEYLRDYYAREEEPKKRPHSIIKRRTETSWSRKHWQRMKKRTN